MAFRANMKIWQSTLTERPLLKKMDIFCQKSTNVDLFVNKISFFIHGILQNTPHIIKIPLICNQYFFNKKPFCQCNKFHSIRQAHIAFIFYLLLQDTDANRQQHSTSGYHQCIGNDRCLQISVRISFICFFVSILGMFLFYLTENKSVINSYKQWYFMG